MAARRVPDRCRAAAGPPPVDSARAEPSPLRPDICSCSLRIVQQPYLTPVLVRDNDTLPVLDRSLTTCPNLETAKKSELHSRFRKTTILLSFRSLSPMLLLKMRVRK